MPENRQFEALYHMSSDEVTDKTDYDLFPPAQADGLRANDLRVFTSGRPVEFEQVVPCDNGDRTFITLKFPIARPGEHPYAVCGISTDLTEQKQAQRCLVVQHAVTLALNESLTLGEAAPRLLRGICQQALLGRAREFAVARSIQLGILPKVLPHVAGFALAGVSHPAQETGGDYLDFFPLSDGSLGIAISDASGHGLGAALVMAETRAVLLARATTDTDVGRVAATHFRSRQALQRVMLAIVADVTQILNAIEAGDSCAAEQLLPLVYDELRNLAVQRLAQEKPGQTLQATALVHEAYLRLVGDQQFENRGHFFAAAAEAMRRILVESARRKKRLRHGGGLHRQPLDDAEPEIAAPVDGFDLLALNDALDRFEAEFPRRARVVKLRYFAGFTLPEVAGMLDISQSTAEADWTYAKAWLRRAMGNI